MTEAKRIGHSQPAYVYDDEELNGVVDKSLDDNTPADFSLPYVFSTDNSGEDGIGGPAVTDPLTLDFRLPALSENGDVGPAWRTTLSELLKDELDILCGLDTDLIDDPGGIDTARKISRRLKELSEYVESRIAPHQP